MEREEIYSNVMELIVDELGLAGVEMDGSTSLSADLGVDSLDIIDVLIRIDGEYGINTGEKVDDIKTMTTGTISDMVDIVDRLIKEKEKSPRSSSRSL